MCAIGDLEQIWTYEQNVNKHNTRMLSLMEKEETK